MATPECIPQETAALASQQSERLRTIEEDHSRYVSALQVQHAGELADAKERAVTAQQDQALKTDQERATLTEKHSAAIAAAKDAQAAAETRVAQITAAQHELELQVRRAFAQSCVA